MLKALAGLRRTNSIFTKEVRLKKALLPQNRWWKKGKLKKVFFQDKVIGEKTRLVGRSTIILIQNWLENQLEVPKLMANKIFQPFIMQKFSKLGI